jgi:acyl carrier protein
MPQLEATAEGRRAEIRELVATTLGVPADEISGTTSFIEDLTADSLLLIEVLGQLEKRYAVEIPQDQLELMVDLDSTYRVVATNAGWDG